VDEDEDKDEGSAKPAAIATAIRAGATGLEPATSGVTARDVVVVALSKRFI